jgi:hypothetical protein
MPRPIIADHVVHDLAALNKTEMLLWDPQGRDRCPGAWPPDADRITL